MRPALENGPIITIVRGNVNLCPDHNQSLYKMLRSKDRTDMMACSNL